MVQVKPLKFVDNMCVTAFGTYAIRRRVVKGWEATFYPMIANVSRRQTSLAYAYKQVIAENLDSEMEAISVAQKHWRTSILSALEQT